MRSMRQYFTPVTSNSEVSEFFQSAPNSGLSGSRTVSIWSGQTLGGSSAINGAQFSTPANEVRTLTCMCNSCAHASMHGLLACTVVSSTDPQ